MPKELRLNLLKRDLNIESNNHNHIKTIMIRERFRRGFAGASNNAKGAVKLKCIYEAVTELYKRTVQNSPFVIADELGSFYEPTPTQLNPKYFTLTPKDSSACPAFDALMEAIEKPSSPLVQRSDLFMQFNLEAVPKTPSIPTFSLFINPPSPFFCLQSAKLAMEVKLEELRLEKDVKVLGVQPVSTFRGSAKRFEIVITLGEDATTPPPSLLHSAVIYAGSETKDAGKPIILFSKFLPTCATCYTMGNNQHATDCTIFLRKQMQHRASEKASNRQPGGGGQGDNITQRPRTHAQTHNGWTLVTRTQNTRTRSSHSSGHSSSGASSSSSSNSNSSSSNSDSSNSSASSSSDNTCNIATSSSVSSDSCSSSNSSSSSSVSSNSSSVSTHPNSPSNNNGNNSSSNNNNTNNSSGPGSNGSDAPSSNMYDVLSMQEEEDDEEEVEQGGGGRRDEEGWGRKRGWSD